MEQPRPDPTRRTLLDVALKGGVAGIAGAVLYPVARYLSPPERAEPGARSVTIDPKNPSQVDPKTRLFAFGDQPGILVKGPAGEWRAFSAVCTHLSCTVRFKAEDQQIWCPCHNGLYDLNGRNIPGTPPPRPLTEFRLQANADGTLVVRK
jgi:cytochrome b6-f complex iron-sulfur subunit